MRPHYACAVFVVICLLPNFNQADSFTTDPYLDSDSTSQPNIITNITIPDVTGIGTVHVTSVRSANLSCPLTKYKSGPHGDVSLYVSTCVNLTNVDIDMPDMRLNATIGLAVFNVSVNMTESKKTSASVHLLLTDWNVSRINGPPLFVNISSKTLKNKHAMQVLLQTEVNSRLKKEANAEWLYKKLSELWPDETSTTFDFTSTTLDMF
ncbi:unnamed protein product [Mesocestoides corti]|uniref:Secreted protein n=1 Tax=Mesocestoides corti TaxID=53468 RepID=A0A0R3UKW1_MESCO|nr:unnamed protein product [Mesocestoides corti]